MISNEQFRQFALSLPEVAELPHFEKTSFRVGKKIVATLSEGQQRACLKLSEIDQSVFAAFDTTAIYPVPNKWGQQGWTILELRLLEEEIVVDALKAAYCEVAPKRLSQGLEP